MMITLQMQLVPHSLAPVNEDPMELTSDLDQRAEGTDDIDIDLDLTGDDSQDGEDEYMGEEDVNALASSTSADGQGIVAANDAEMADDTYTQGLADARSSVRDEGIEDAEYTGPEMDEDTLIEPDTDRPDEQSEELLANYEEAGEDQGHVQEYQEQEYNEHQHHGYLTTLETESGFHKEALLDGQTELVSPSHALGKVATEESTERYNPDSGKEVTIVHGVVDQVPEHSDVEGSSQSEPEQEIEHKSLLSVDQEVVARSHVEGSHIEEEDRLTSPVHLHPIVLDYQGDEMFLFPPVDQIGEHTATFLLADEQLAYTTIGNLLEACRSVLKESLSEHDELTISVDDLDLHVSESTIECATTRFSEVVDLYVRLQQNDGIENPPPLYMDLTIRNRFSHRLNLLRNALTEGTGLSQLKFSHKTDIDQQHGNGQGIDLSNQTAVQSSNRAYVSVQPPAGKAEGSVNQHNLHEHSLHAERLMQEIDSTPQGTQLYTIKGVTYTQTDRPESLPGGDLSARETGVSDDVSREVAESKEIHETAQALVHDSELQKAEESTVDDGDFIDYEDVEELYRGTSSASSTLQGDTINIHAAQDRAVPNEPKITGKAVADEETIRGKESNFAVVSAEDEQHDDAQIPSQDSNDKVQRVFGHFDEEDNASNNDQDASVSPGRESQLKLNAEQQHDTSTLCEDDAGSKWQGASHDHADQLEGGAYALADTNSDGEVEDYPLTYPLDSESSGSRRNLRDEDRDRVGDLEVDNGPEEADTLSVNDDSDDTPQSLQEVNRRPFLLVDESPQTHEDDDEITYEDEEYDINPPPDPAEAEHTVAKESGFLKHARSLHEDDDALGEDLQGAKRVRSG